MGAGKLAENTLNANKIFGQICLSSTQVYVFQKKSLWVSVVRVHTYVRSAKNFLR